MWKEAEGGGREKVRGGRGGAGGGVNEDCRSGKQKKR